MSDWRERRQPPWESDPALWWFGWILSGTLLAIAAMAWAASTGVRP